MKFCSYNYYYHINQSLAQSYSLTPQNLGAEFDGFTYDPRRENALL